MKRLAIILPLCAFIYGILAPVPVVAAIYYFSDFEDGSLGGGVAFPGYELPVNIASSNLDGKALQFGYQPESQLQWVRNGPDSSLHHVSFDYFSNQGANVTQFLDIPTILRLDVSDTGRHHVDVYYDITNKIALSYLDGVLDTSKLTILVWSIPGIPTESKTVRIANQTVAPGNSNGIFEIDNFLWESDVPMPVPEPSTMLLLGSGLLGLVGCGRRRLKK